MSNFEYPAEPPYMDELEPYVNSPQAPEEESSNTETDQTVSFLATISVGGLASMYTGVYTAMDAAYEVSHHDADIPTTIIRVGAGGTATTLGALTTLAAARFIYEKFKHKYK